MNSELSEKEIIIINDKEAAPHQKPSDEPTRETWTGKLDFILSSIGYTVGLGNIWRFPYICFKNGGGAFLVPYFVFMVLCGIPLQVLEMCLGQFASLAPTALFERFCPLFQGVGWAQVLVSGICCIYYNMIIAWTMYYLVLSLRSSLLWASCGHAWNTDDCVSGMKYIGINGTTVENSTRKTASEEFWENYILRVNEAGGIGDIGPVQWDLCLALAVAWLFIFACLFRGVRTSGKVVYVTAVFPYILLLALLCRGLTLPGAMDGLSYYFIPEWRKLLDVNVWIAAASQIFYSLGPGWGVLYTFASFNQFHHNIYRDATMIPIICCATSVFAGSAVFSILGFMAKEAGKKVGDVIATGPGLAFIIYPEAVSNFPISPLWAVLFFLMILTVGVDSQFAQFETFVSSFVDTWPRVLRKRKTPVTAGFCVFLFLCGLPCTTKGGIYVLQLMDWYVALFTVFIAGAAECLLVAWNYGAQRFVMDIHLMVGYYPSRWFLLLWKFVTPGVAVALLVALFIKHTPVTYDEYEYPGWAIKIGWFIAMVSSLPIPVYAAINLFWRRRSMPFAERIVDVMRPTPEWGPALYNDRQDYKKSLSQVPSKQLYVGGENAEIQAYPDRDTTV